MDSRDLSSSMTAASRDGSSADEDGVLSVTAALAKDAALLFQSRKFDECVEVLSQLVLKKGDDPKVLHNIAIAEYFRDDCSDPKKLLDVLNTVKKRSEGLTHASFEQVDTASNLGNKILTGSKGNGMTRQNISATNSTGIAFRGEFDTSVPTLNMATVWFHLHEYAKVLSILEPLYQNIEPIDETTALHVCLLLLDAALASHDASRSAVCSDFIGGVINYLEKAFGDASQADLGSAALQQSSRLVLKSSSVPTNATDISVSDPATYINSSETSLSRAFSDEALEYDNLLSTLDMGQNLTRAPGIPSLNDISKIPTDRSDLKLKLQLYKVRLLIFTRNIKAAKREVKIAMNITRGKDSSMALLLKSQLEYARGNHRKAIKLLVASSNRSEAGFSSLFNNNLGCIHHQLGRPHTSTVFFSQALKNSHRLQKDKPRKLSTFSQDKSILIMYNCGIQYLTCGKPRLAADCLLKASLVFHDRPVLWFRLAECCLMAYGGACKSGVKAHVIGEGKWRQLVLNDRNSMDTVILWNGQLELSLPFARQCLVNALHLLSKYLKSGPPSNVLDSPTSCSVPSNVNGDVKDQKGMFGLTSTLQSSVSDYEDGCRRESRVLKQAVLANLAYVELELGNPLKALSAAKSLLELSKWSGIYLFLGHVYAAEALCLLKRLKEASDHLSVYLSVGFTVQLPFSEQEWEAWRFTKTVEMDDPDGSGKGLPLPESQLLRAEEARVALCVNLAALSAVEGDLEQAYRFTMQALSVIPNHSEAILMAVYVELRLGKPREALARLKCCNRVTFFPGSSVSGSS